MGQTISLLVESASTINFCGKQIHTFRGQAYQPPFKVEPTTGDKHDYKTCVGCQENYNRDLENAKRKFELFPDCCENHKNLKDYSFFNKENYIDFPEQFADKALFTKNHIINNIEKEDWFIDITNYLDYIIKSFGQSPNKCGEPLMVTAFIELIRRFLRDNVKVFKVGKVESLIDFLDNYYEPVNERETDLNLLLSTYQEWLNIFPFELSIFSPLKRNFESTLPILKDKPVYNPYLKAHRGVFIDQESLISTLIDRTNYLLTEINALTLYKKGELIDVDKVKLELVLESRKLKLKTGYKNDSENGQERFRKILHEWFEDEKRFIDEIRPLLKRENKPAIQPNEGKLKINQIALIHIYENKQITRQNADEIAAQYGYNSKNSGEGLFQDYITFSSPANRRGKPTPCTPKKLKNKIALFESISNYLTDKAKEKMNDELRLLKTLFENEFE